MDKLERSRSLVNVLIRERPTTHAHTLSFFPRIRTKTDGRGLRDLSRPLKSRRVGKSGRRTPTLDVRIGRGRCGRSRLGVFYRGKKHAGDGSEDDRRVVVALQRWKIRVYHSEKVVGGTKEKLGKVF